jgi:hypothetical protein
LAVRDQLISSECFPGLRTAQAFTISPHFGSGIPKTATSRETSEPDHITQRA